LSNLVASTISQLSFYNGAQQFLTTHAYAEKLKYLLAIQQMMKSTEIEARDNK